jgi:hypothetical protein
VKLTSGAHGYLRFTKDVDVVIQLIPDNIERTFTALASLGYRPIVPITMKQFSNSELSAARRRALPRDRLAGANLELKISNFLFDFEGYFAVSNCSKSRPRPPVERP